MNEKDLIELAGELLFDHAAVINTSDLVVVPEYRTFCEENLCGNYNLLPACPPASGTVEEMRRRILAYEKVLVLQTVVELPDLYDTHAQKEAKKRHNRMTEALMQKMRENGMEDLLMMAAGPWKKASCMSAYCVDAQKMAEAAGMLCWENDGRTRFFSSVLFHA